MFQWELEEREIEVILEHLVLNNGRKKVYFFELPYWEFTMLRHNLDIMRIEQNVFDNLAYTLLGDKKRRR